MSSTSRSPRAANPKLAAEPGTSGFSFKRLDAAALLGLFAVTLAFFWPMIRPRDHWYIVSGDFSNQFFPFRAFAATEWWSGRIPLWNPDMLAGHPFLADVQTAIFYPPALLNALIFGRNGFPFYALEGEVVVHTYLAAAFTYLLARKVSGSRLGAIVSAVAFGFGGFITSYPAQQLAVLETAVWLPLLVLCLELAFDTGIRLRWIAAAGFVFGIAILAGHPQTDLFIAYSAGGYLLWRLWWRRARVRDWVASVVLFATCALGLAAIQILPTLAFLRTSIRTQMDYAEAAHGYLLSSLPEILVPLWHGEKALSIGVVALFLAIVGVWAARREPLFYWAVAGLIAVPLSTGGATPLFWFLYHLVPGWDLFRDQERVIYVFSFAGALFAARGVAWLVKALGDDVPTAFLRWLRVAWLLAAIAGGLALVLSVAGDAVAYPVSLRENLALDAAVLAALAVGLRLARSRFVGVNRANPVSGIPIWTAALLILLVVGEAFAINYGNNLGPNPSDARPRLAATAAFLRDFPEPFRVRGISEDVFPSDYGAMVGLPTIGGDTPFLDQRMDEMLKADADWRVWQILNVKFFLSDGPPLAGMKLAFQDGNLKTYAVDDSLPRAWAVRAVEVAKNPAEAKQMILAPGYHPGNIVVLEKAPALGPFVAGPRPDVKITHLDPQRVEIDANGDGNAMLVLADRYDADWVAYRDGVPVPTFQANYLATAMELPPGQHHYVLVYRPVAFYVGAGVSLVTLLLVAAFALADARVRRQVARARLGFRVPRGAWAGAVAVLLVAGFALRLHSLGQPTLTNDEWFMLRNHDEGPLWIIHQAHTFEPHPLLYYLGLAGWIELAGRSEFAMRFPSAVFGVVLIAATVGIGRQLIGRRGALLVGLLVAVNPYLIAESQNARNYAMVCALGTIATLLFWRAMKRGRTADWVAYAVAMFLALNTHLDAALVFAAHLCFLAFRALSSGWLRDRKRGWLRLRRGVVAVGAVGALFVLWLLWAWPALLAYHGYFPQPVTVPQVVGRTLATFSLGAESSIRRSLPFVALAAVGVAWLITRRRDRALFLGVSVLLPFALVAILFTRRPMFDERYLIVLAPVFLVAVAAGLEGLLRRLAPAGGLALLAALALVVQTLPAVYSSQLTDRGDYRSMAAWISTYGRPNDVIVATGYGQAELFGYYYHGPDPVRVIDSPDQLAAELPGLAADHGVWLLPYWQSPADNAAVATLDAKAAPVAEQWFVNTRALYYAPLNSLAPVGATASFEGGLLLKAAALDEGAVRPGDAVATRLDWSVATAVTDAKLSLRLLDDQGQVVAQHDLALADGALPTGTAQTPAGIFVPATAPPGHYQLAALLYHSDSGASFKLSSDAPHNGDLLFLGPVTVEPRLQPIAFPNDGISQTASTSFSEGVSLLGHGELDGTLSVGDRRDVTLLWRANRKLSIDLPRSVEFLNAAGAVVATSSGPILPEYPTSHWQPGLPIAEHLGVVVPVALPSGSYTVRLAVGGKSVVLGTVGVSSPTRQFTAPPVGQSVGVPIGSFATLVGYTAPTSVPSGATIKLNVVWQARGTADRPYTAFVHLLDPGGQIVAQVDRPPGDGQRPTTTWAKGEYLQDNYALAVPGDATAGAYTIEIGLYDQDSGLRLPITLASGSTADHIVAARVAVTGP